MTSSSERADVAVITVQFRNAADTAALAASLSKLAGAESIELFVVDNAQAESKAGQQDLGAGLPFPVRWLPTGTNLYYWGGASFALNAIRAERGSLPRWVMICNNDITIAEPNFLTTLSRLDPLSNTIIAPSVVSTVTGREQNPLLETPPAALKRLKWRIYDTNFHVARAMLRVHGATRDLFLRPTKKPPESLGPADRAVYAAHGACVILSSRFFELGGSLDTTVPMFAEELTLAVAAKKLGISIRYISELRVSHAEHSTTGPRLTREKYEMERSARLHYYSLLNDNPSRA